MNQQALSSFIWPVADLLRGDYKQSEYGKAILPFTLLRRLNCVLGSNKEAVLAEHSDKQKTGINPEPFLLHKAGQSFYNTSLMDMKRLMSDQDYIKKSLYAYIQGFAPAYRRVYRVDWGSARDAVTSGPRRRLRQWCYRPGTAQGGSAGQEIRLYRLRAQGRAFS